MLFAFPLNTSIPILCFLCPVQEVLDYAYLYILIIKIGQPISLLPTLPIYTLRSRLSLYRTFFALRFGGPTCGIRTLRRARRLPATWLARFAVDPALLGGAEPFRQSTTFLGHYFLPLTVLYFPPRRLYSFVK